MEEAAAERALFFTSYNFQKSRRFLSFGTEQFFLLSRSGKLLQLLSLGTSFPKHQ